MELELILKNLTDSVIITKQGEIKEWSGITESILGINNSIKGTLLVDLLNRNSSENIEDIMKGKVFKYKLTGKSIKLVSNSNTDNNECIWIFHDMSNRIKIDSFMDEYYDNMYQSLNKIIEEKTRDLKSINAHLEELVEKRTKLLGEKNTYLEETLKTLKVTQNKLIQSEKISSLGRIIVGLAHNINTPLGVCITASSYLEENITKSTNELLNYDDIKVSFGLLTRNLSKISSLIDSMKSFSGQNLALYKENFNLKDLVDEIAESYTDELKHGNHKIIINITSDINLYDYKKLYFQIFTSLIDNCLIHGFKGKTERELIISGKLVNNNMLELVIKNNGKMIKQELIGKLFDPFYTTSYNTGHKGLGLSNIHTIVNDSLNGDIFAFIENEYVTFKIEIPKHTETSTSSLPLKQ